MYSARSTVHFSVCTVCHQKCLYQHCLLITQPHYKSTLTFNVKVLSLCSMQKRVLCGLDRNAKFGELKLSCAQWTQMAGRQHRYCNLTINSVLNTPLFHRHFSPCLQHTHLSVLIEPGEHNDDPTLSFTDHLPEVPACRLHGTLCYDESLLLFVALHIYQSKRIHRLWIRIHSWSHTGSHEGSHTGINQITIGPKFLSHLAVLSLGIRTVSQTSWYPGSR